MKLEREMMVEVMMSKTDQTSGEAKGFWYRNMNVVAKIYSGCYGGEMANCGDLIACTVECGGQSPSFLRKQVIFVVDESGSMISTILPLQASLFAARNSFLRLNGVDVTEMDEATRDQMFSQSCNSSLITFSDQAHYRWESEVASREQGQPHTFSSFSQAVNQIRADTSTNMGDALQMAFAKKTPGYITWIILLTDGVSNKGSIQSVPGFKDMMQRLPPLTKIIPLGYTTNFDPEVLSSLGTMTYVDSEENIAEIIGSITAEIMTTYGFDAKITLPSLPAPIPTPDDIIIVPPEIATRPIDVIGSPTIGCLFNERQFIYGHLPWGNNLITSDHTADNNLNNIVGDNVQKSPASNYIGLSGSVEYFDIQMGVMVTVPFQIEDDGSVVPDAIREAYFAASKGRILLDIYRQGKLSQVRADLIRRKIADWLHPTAAIHREEILRILSQRHSWVDRITSLTSAQSTQTQSAYRVGRYTTSTQIAESFLTSNDACAYTTSHDLAMIPPRQP